MMKAMKVNRRAPMLRALRPLADRRSLRDRQIVGLAENHTRRLNRNFHCFASFGFFDCDGEQLLDQRRRQDAGAVELKRCQIVLQILCAQVHSLPPSSASFSVANSSPRLMTGFVTFSSFSSFGRDS